MPHPTAVRITDAALEVLGAGGLHALSHTRVDATAGLPTGSTSNHFRTRAALVTATVARLRQIDAENFQARLAAGLPASLDELIDAYAAFVDDATGPSRARTVARYVIFIQGVVEPALLEQLNADRRLLADWTAAALTAVGAPAGIASTLLAAVEGLILHRLTDFTTGPAGPDVRRLVTGLTGHGEHHP
ncbi:TetR/AcrR family transcriptional regulator [Actinoplanes palleronii]|uniref:Tetracyclin repressor-like C-terminal group 31 domain-containing protein n=1 Tax=Actinoplanes palleronii TaxID=113570 RepID=A0ABQ4BGL3_9ACTN|nr:TetR family transcriptional regulator [Actinoplanes palleronii]GIE69831.1 hypothetical protein Apa02nite_059390 [Actinoplanes palleronii]